jgi:hypothetical protein
LAKRLRELQERIAKHQVELSAAKADRVAAKASVLNSGCGGGDPGAVPVSLAGAFSIVQAKLQAEGAGSLHSAGVSEEHLRVLSVILNQVQVQDSPTESNRAAFGGGGGEQGGGVGTGAAATSADVAPAIPPEQIPVEDPFGDIEMLDDSVLERFGDVAPPVSADGSALEQWRVVCRTKARKLAEVMPEVLAKRAKQQHMGSGG